MVDAAPGRDPPVRILGSRHLADLVDRCRGPPEPHLPGPPRSHLGPALLAPGRAGTQGGPRRPPGRHRRRYRQGPCRLPPVAGTHPPGRPGLAGRDPAALLAPPPAQTGPGRLSAARIGRQPGADLTVNQLYEAWAVSARPRRPMTSLRGRG